MKTTKRKPPLRTVSMKTWQALGQTGERWEFQVRICNRHGHIKSTFDGRDFVQLFLGGISLADLAKHHGMTPDLAEESLRQVLNAIRKHQTARVIGGL